MSLMELDTEINLLEKALGLAIKTKQKHERLQRLKGLADSVKRIFRQFFAFYLAQRKRKRKRRNASTSQPLRCARFLMNKLSGV